ncbi:hypothetical protein H696_04992 [Fonticula alba]|uniref:Nitric oxide synthase-interacting protein zinc-finger domain-containing protein n=1 Tax=Fonticula alba TaxID=691883 RepID=A0A058Z331_FONAL|nr:hypothetical protein H696_04992 [Fonticula alba]KCV68704.1 hypothetical protein H696_04992 [Fonticula alba]|eukprot:XP_009497136.1 hypothetical protein H696_04992 [Fonticula alba]
MGRKGKNSTTRHCYSTRERQLDSRESKWGTQRLRLSGDSQHRWDHCWITQQRPSRPVITPDGYLYDYEAILENLLVQRQQLVAARDEQAQARKRQADRRQREQVRDRAKRVRQFEALDSGVISASSTGPDPKKAIAVSSATGLDVPAAHSTDSSLESAADTSDRSDVRSSFWIPENAPELDSDEEDARLQQAPIPKSPSCPISGRPLRMKDLIRVVFTPVSDPDCARGDTPWMCPVTHETLTDVTSVVVLRQSGYIVSRAALDQAIAKDRLDPFAPAGAPKMDLARDVIPLKTGGTSFAASADADALIVKKVNPAFN